MARLGGICTTCRAANVGPSHWQTATHRRRVERAEHIPDLTHELYRPGSWTAAGTDNGTAEQNAEALRRLTGEPPLWVDEAPAVEPWEDHEYQEPSRPERSIRPGPCHRCGRSDFRTEAGRSWHVANVPTCTAYVRPDRHEYVTMPA